eukprot:1283-Heterococcus_DN1.PRE.2
MALRINVYVHTVARGCPVNIVSHSCFSTMFYKFDALLKTWFRLLQTAALQRDQCRTVRSTHLRIAAHAVSSI